uniref:Lambda C capping enzyme n=1 Tax=Corvid orthoreovirus TaxID=2737667 RepID=A0A6M5XP14_9REOV|nr:lambda C capping enzyme [Corvid orthoreovirus]
MAQIRGLRLSNLLTVPQVQSPLVRLTYDDLLKRLTLQETPWIPLHNPSINDPVCVQLLFPLQALLSDRWLTPRPDNFKDWTTWMKDQLYAISTTLLRDLPIADNHGAFVNPIIANAVVAGHFSCTPYHHLIPHLMLKVDPVTDIIAAGVTLPGHFWFHAKGVIASVPGLKYITFANYSFADDDPCLFGKHETPYAMAYYHDDRNLLLSFAENLPYTDTPLMHLDRPSYGDHILVPSGSVVNASGSTLYTMTSWIVAETALDQLIANNLSSNRRPMLRLIQSMLCVRSPFFDTKETVEYALIALANSAVSGHQLTFGISKRPTCAEVRTLMAQLSDTTKPITTPTPVPRKFVLYQNVEWDYPDSVRLYLTKSGPYFSGSTGSVTYTKDVPASIAWQPQFDPGTLFPLDVCMSKLQSAITLPIQTSYGNAWSGDAYFTFGICKRDVLSYPLNVLPQFPSEYFSQAHQNSRAKFSSYRAVKDRSFAKDSANIRFISGIVKGNGERYLRDGITVAYCGASGTHPDDQPTIIKPWMNGNLQNAFRPLRVRQFGWEVTRGTILDVELPIASGTFGYVYSDVDQVQIGCDDLSQSDKHFATQLDSLTHLIAPHGSLTVKCNFPTRFVYHYVFSVVSAQFDAVAVTKPMISNNLECYFHFLGKFTQSQAPFGPSSDIVSFFRQQYTRYQAIVDAFTIIPHRGSAVSLDDPLSGVSINFVDALSLQEQDDVQALSAFSLLSSVPTMRIASHPYFDSYRTNLAGLVTPDSRNLLLRAGFCPRVYPSTINVQTRSITTSPPKIFDHVASHWTLLSMFYNYQLSLFRPQSGYWMDLGTGPECRMLSIVDSDVPLIMVDTRPPIYPMNCWKSPTEYLQLNYLDHDVVAQRPPEILSAVLTLGAAAADSGLSLSNVLTTLMDQTLANLVNKVIFQLNCPLDDHLEVSSSILKVDRRRKVYSFVDLGREEPFLDVDEVVNLVRTKYNDAVLEIRCADYDLSWLMQPFSNGVGLTSAALSTATALSKYCPLFIIHTDIKAAIFSANPVVSREMTITVNDYDPSVHYVVEQNGVELLRYSSGVLSSIVDVSSAVADNRTLTIRMTPTNVGMITVTRVNGVTDPLGSIQIQAPDPSVITVWPRNIDVTDAGTNVDVYVDDWFELRVFYEIKGVLYPVSDDKYDFRRNSMWHNRRTLNIILDRADAFYSFYLADVQSGVPASYIKHQLHDLSVPVWPNDSWTFLSPPSHSDYVIQTDEGPIPLYPPFDVYPSSWYLSDVPTSADASLPSFLVPPGHYGIVRI